MNIIVCVKQVPDPEAPPASFKVDPATNKVIPPQGVPPVISPFDEQAVEAALRPKDAHGGRIVALSLGPASARDVLKHAMAMGADEGVLLEDPALSEPDSSITAMALAAAIKKLGEFDLIFCGRQAADWDAGQVGSGMAEVLGIPSVTVARKVEVSDGKIRVERVLADGYEVIESPMPALVTVSNELGEPRHATLKGGMAAARKNVTTWTAADLGLEPSRLANRTKLLKLFVPVREGSCEMVEGETAAEAGANLALRLRQAKIV